MSGITAVETQAKDPMLYLAAIPYLGRFYPYGFPVDIATNTQEVLDAAAESWGVYAPRFDTPPIRFHVVTSAGSRSTPPEPVLRGQRHLLAWMFDPENFSVCDYLQRFGFCCVTRATVEDRVFFRYHFLDAVVLTLLELNYFTSLHAACLVWNDAGLLLSGESGVGKSTLSYACAKRGWTFVSDDGCSILRGSDRNVIGEPHHFRLRAEAVKLFPELRGLTVGRQLNRKPTLEVYTADLPVRTASECRVERIVFLDRQSSVRARLTPLDMEETQKRLRQERAVFDPALEDWRAKVVDSIAALPSYELRYSAYEDAVLLLEQLMQSGDES
jgi:hypothetical protein